MYRVCIPKKKPCTGCVSACVRMPYPMFAPVPSRHHEANGIEVAWQTHFLSLPQSQSTEHLYCCQACATSCAQRPRMLGPCIAPAIRHSVWITMFQKSRRPRGGTWMQCKEGEGAQRLNNMSARTANFFNISTERWAGLRKIANTIGSHVDHGRMRLAGQGKRRLKNYRRIQPPGLAGHKFQ